MTARSLNERWNSHCSAAKNGSPFRFHSAIRKYGKDSFIAEILYDNLNIEECRTLEEQTILEYNTTNSGYNAKPGGCGGWIIPDKKYDEWLSKVTLNSTRESNGRWSGYSDEFILEQCVIIFKEYKNLEDFTYKDLLDKVRKKYNIPKSFSKNRFKDYQNSFKVGLSSKLEITLEELDKLSNKKSKTHKESLSKANVGNSWYSNDKLKLSKQSKTDLGDGWYEGRIYGNKNKKN